MNSFSVISIFDYKAQESERIAKEIESKGKEYVLGVDETEFKNYLVSKYTLEPLVIDYENVSMGNPQITKEWFESRGFREKYQGDVYSFTLTYPFYGSSEIFKIRPSTYQGGSVDLTVGRGTVSFSFKLYKQDPQEFEREKNLNQDRAFANVVNANKDIEGWNREVVGIVNTHFRTHKEKWLKQNNFFEAIKLKVNTGNVFAAPTIEKIVIPQPAVSKGKEFSSEPTMAKEIYNDILKVIFDSGKNMETKPSLYQGKDETGLRDQFLFVLESRYKGTTATGETFNRSGKADILLKYANDGTTNLFVAECKIWHGPSEFHKAISQLFDLYLTWRDSKTALLFFVKNKEFTNVLQSIKEEAKKHPYYVKENGERGESSFSYIFRLPQDADKKVYFEIIAFHYDK